jgi:hypothetical protein
MHTLFDFVTRVNGVQYLLAFLFIFGVIIFFEIMKPRPFKGLAASVSEDAQFIKAQGKEGNVQLLKNMAMAPVYLVVYLAAVPVLFLKGMAEPVGALTSAGWSPVRAYFTGARKAKKAKGNDSGKRASE